MRLIRTEVRRIARDEFTTPQYRLLLKISREPCSVRELADWMGVAMPTISKMVNVLVKRGLAARGENPAVADRRQILVSPTPKGREKVGRIQVEVQKALQSSLSRLPAPRRKALFSGLQVLRELFLLGAA
ncbi:MAG: MarR family winged helix-turn-helix transcriptional regulator [Bdellovibrionota bacterium]